LLWARSVRWTIAAAQGICRIFVAMLVGSDIFYFYEYENKKLRYFGKLSLFAL